MSDCVSVIIDVNGGGAPLVPDRTNCLVSRAVISGCGSVREYGGGGVSIGPEDIGICGKTDVKCALLVTEVRIPAMLTAPDGRRAGIDAGEVECAAASDGAGKRGDGSKPVARRASANELYRCRSYRAHQRHQRGGDSCKGKERTSCSRSCTFRLTADLEWSLMSLD